MALLIAACTAGAQDDKAADSYSKPEPLIINQSQKAAFQLGANLLANYSYHRLSLSEASAPSWEDYLQALDFSHIYFLQSDIDEFALKSGNLKNNVRRADLSDAAFVFERYRQRASDLNAWTLERLQKPFNLDSQDSVDIPNYRDRTAKRPWFSSIEEVHAYQEKRLADQIIRLRLAGRTQEQAIEKLTGRYRGLQRRLNQMTSEDMFDFYMNAIAGTFDPHSNYFSPRMTEDFDINMSLSLEGIGATLSNEDDKIMINELVPGGPAYRSGKLHVKDRIIGVGQGSEGEMQDIIGMRLDKAVRLIRGKKGTFVRLLIEPAGPNEPERTILLQRDKISLEEQAAAGYVEEVKQNGRVRKIGVIRLPSFYMDFNAAQAKKKNYRSTSRDIARIINDMKAQNVEGIIIDLRGDGGGSLAEAVTTVGLFIGKGPVVQVVGTDSAADIEESDVKAPLWTGPLAVMIDHGSASASEIFAAAIQDYHRGIIIGSNSFGKGTVQTVIDLNRFAPSKTPSIGEMKMTIAMFFRITGSSTQIKGVVPDIELPAANSIDDVGERAEPHALQWKSISPADYQKSADVPIDIVKELQIRHLARMKDTPLLSRYTDYMQRVEQENQKTTWSLNLGEREKEYKQWKQYTDSYDTEQAAAMPPLKSDEKRKKDLDIRNLSADTEADKETFVPDVGLYEALQILFDYIELHRTAAQPKNAA